MKPAALHPLQSQRQTQQPRLAQQIRLALRLLSLSPARLDAFVRYQVAGNPALRWRSPSSVPAYEIALEKTSATPLLSDHLLQQLYIQPCSDDVKMAAEIIIDSLDGDGFLREPLARLREQFEYAPAGEANEQHTRLWQRALQQVQSLEPTGVGATDLRECLMLQLNEIDSPETELARILVQHHLDEIPHLDGAALAGRLQVPPRRLQAAISLIERLNPRPGGGYAQAAEPIRPEAEIISEPDRLAVRLLEPFSEAIELRLDEELPASQKLAARHILQAIRLGEQNLKRILELAVRTQEPWLLSEDKKNMQPMTQSALARQLELHPSTVSRAVSHCYLLWRGGTIAVRELFSHALPGPGGGAPAMAATAVMATIRELIAGEDPASPLSDEDCRLLLGEHGIGIARRTVSKYRRRLNIPPAGQRKHKH